MNQEYITQNGWIVTEDMYKEIKEICWELEFNEILRLVDMFKDRNIQSSKDL